MLDESMQDLSLAEPAGESSGVLKRPVFRPTPQLRDKDPVTGAKVYANRAEWEEARERHKLWKVKYDADLKAWRAQEDKFIKRAPRQYAHGVRRGPGE